MNFLDMLAGAERANQSMLCVGLDPEPTRFPGRLKGDANKIYDFCAAIVDATADLVSSFKPQIAYFAAHRAEGQLERLMEHMRRVAPQVPTRPRGASPPVRGAPAAAGAPVAVLARRALARASVQPPKRARYLSQPASRPLPLAPHGVAGLAQQGAQATRPQKSQRAE